MRISGLLGIALLFAALALFLAVRASDALAAIIDSFPAVLLAAASLGAIAINARSTQARPRVVLAILFSAVFVALLGTTFLGFHIWHLVSGPTPSLRTLLLGVSYLLGATFVLASLRVTVRLLNRP